MVAIRGSERRENRLTRYLTITEKIPRERTGLKSNLFVHVDHELDGTFHQIRFSEKKKDGNTLDNVLTALGDTATDIIRGLRKPGDTAA